MEIFRTSTTQVATVGGTFVTGFGVALGFAVERNNPLLLIVSAVFLLALHFLIQRWTWFTRGSLDVARDAEQRMGWESGGVASYLSKWFGPPTVNDQSWQVSSVVNYWALGGAGGTLLVAAFWQLGRWFDLRQVSLGGGVILGSALIAVVGLFVGRFILISREESRVVRSYMERYTPVVIEDALTDVRKRRQLCDVFGTEDLESLRTKLAELLSSDREKNQSYDYRIGESSEAQRENHALDLIRGDSLLIATPISELRRISSRVVTGISDLVADERQFVTLSKVVFVRTNDLLTQSGEPIVDSVPIGSLTDFASIPPGFRWLVGHPSTTAVDPGT